MDRRDALKKIAAGGAVATGASLIVSKPALAAFNQPSISLQPSAAGDTTPGNNRLRRVNLSWSNPISCPGSANNTLGTFSFFIDDVVLNDGLNSLAPLGPTSSTFLSVLQSGPYAANPPQRFNAGDNFRVNVSVTGAVCDYPGGDSSPPITTSQSYRVTCTSPATKGAGGIRTFSVAPA